MNRMPLPITLDTTTAAASMTPSRRSRSRWTPVGGSAGAWPVIDRPSFGEQLPGYAVLAQTGPLPRAVLHEQFDLGVLELRVLQHLRARRRARVAQVARQVERAQRLARFE